MNIIIIETDIIAIGRYVHTADVSGTVSMRVGGSWSTNSPAGMSGPRRGGPDDGTGPRSTLGAPNGLRAPRRYVGACTGSGLGTRTVEEAVNTVRGGSR
ncbi:hypothetical protein ACRAWF_27885 [Streptomyces sp. L7]